MALIPKPVASSGSDTVLEYAAVDFYRNGVFHHSFASAFFPRSKFYTYAQGYKLDDYYKRLASGQLLPFTPWTQYKIDGGIIRPANVNLVGANHDEWRCSDGDCPSTFSSSPFLGAAELLNKAKSQDCAYLVQQAAARIRTAGYDALTFLAEFHQTVELFRNLVSRLASLLSNKKVDDLWLEGRYGWRNLWFDMTNIYDAYLSITEKRTRYHQVAGYKFTESSSTTDGPTSDVYGTWQVITTNEIEVGLRGTVVSDIQVPHIQIDPILTGWELTRLSFVIDWIVNVGNALAALEFLILNNEYYAASGVQVTWTRSIDHQFLGFLNGYGGSYDRGKMQSVGVATYRVPTSVSYIPQVKLRLDGLKILDILALLAQALTKSKVAPDLYRQKRYGPAADGLSP